MPTRNLPPPPLAPDDPGLRELRQIQESFAAALFRPLAPGDRMQARWVDGRPMRKVAAEFIKPNDRLTPFERLEIYNKVYWYRVLDSMYDDFPVVRAVVGERKFMRLITQYLASFPSESYTLRDLGREFVRFIQEHPELVGAHRLLAEEAARFEWAQVIAFDSEARPPLALDAALGRDPSELRLDLQPYLSLLDLAYPLDDFTIAIHRRERVRANASNTTLEMAERPKLPRVRKPGPERVCIGVHRQENQLYYKRLDPVAFAILAALREGRSLAEACDAGAARAEPGSDLVTSIRQWFHDWARLGWLCERQQG
jgi:hypothetical protein